MMNYEKELDIKQFIVDVLRRWRLLIIAMLVLGGLLCLLEVKNQLTQEPQLVMEEDELTKAQDRITEIDNTLASYENSIPAAQSSLADYEQQLELEQAAWEKVMKARNIDAELMVEIVSLTESIGQLQNQITSTTQNIENMENSIPTLEAEREQLEVSVAETVRPDVSVSDIITRFILGVILGVILVCGYVFVRWFFDKTIQPDEITLIGKIPSVGTTYVPTPSRKHTKLDKFMDKLAGCDQTMDEDQVYALAAAKLQLLARDKKQILITGTLEQEVLNTVAQKLGPKITDDSVTVLVGANPVNHAGTVQALAEANVLLVEEIHRSKTSEVVELIEFLRQTDSQPIAAFTI